MLYTLRQKLVRIFYPYGSIRSVRRGPMTGYQFYISPGMGFSYAWGREKMHLSWFESVMKPGMSVYDVGANRGQMALYFAKKVGPNGFVASFEPVPDVYKLLFANVELNRLSHVKTYCAAAADVDGFLKFEFHPTYSTQGKIADCEPEYRITSASELKVEAMKLDTLVQSGLRPPDLIKIDVEGGAALVLKGVQQLIAKHRPLIYCELHGQEEKESVRELANVHKYRIFDINNQEIADFDRSTEQAICCKPA